MAPSNKVFSLEGKGLKLTSEADLEAHIAPLRALEDVEEVRLMGNTLGVGACKLLGEVLATKKTLKNANFADIFTGRLLSEIPEALSLLLTSILNLPNLTTINLNDNAFGINTVAPLLPFLSSHIPLQHLYLNNNGLGPHAGILVADALSQLHAKKESARKDGKEVPDLETVICGRNRLENGSMIAWAKAYALHNKIKTVKMVQNGIRPEGIAQLVGEGLIKASGLEVLDLQDNTFTFVGSVALSKAVPEWAGIKELGVGDTLLRGKGGVLLAEALSKGKNQKLEILRVAYNEITADGLNGLATAAKDSLPALKRIEINGNKFEDDHESVVALQELLAERKDKLAGDVVIEDDWGLDSLSDLEGEDSDDEDEDEDEDISAEDRVKFLSKAADEAQEAPTVKVKDASVDTLTEKLEKTSI